jgi:hypothetical protein
MQYFLEQCSSISRNYYRDLGKINSSTDEDIDRILQLQSYYGTQLEAVANIILEENMTEEYLKKGNIIEMSNGNVEYIDESMKTYVMNNTEILKRKGLIDVCDINTECLVCGRRILGIGLQDDSDAGYAICFSCITEENYVGGGCNFKVFK